MCAKLLALPLKTIQSLTTTLKTLLDQMLTKNYKKMFSDVFVIMKIYYWSNFLQVHMSYTRC